MEINMNSWKFFAVTLVLAGAMVLSALVLSKFFLKIRHEQSIAVKGYAEQDVVSDFGRFAGRFLARGKSLPEAYAGLARARDAVTARLKAAGFNEAEIAVETIDSVKVAKRDAQGKEMNDVEFHDLAQTVTIESTNVALIRDAARALGELIKDDIDLTVYAPSFYITDLQDIKIKLLAKATADGYRRALTLAENSGGQVGALTSAGQGVFQITTRNSTETSGYGVYDESTIEKTVKAIVNLEYEIKPE